MGDSVADMVLHLDAGEPRVILCSPIDVSVWFWTEPVVLNPEHGSHNDKPLQGHTECVQGKV